MDLDRPWIDAFRCCVPTLDVYDIFLVSVTKYDKATLVSIGS